VRISALWCECTFLFTPVCTFVCAYWQSVWAWTTLAFVAVQGCVIHARRTEVGCHIDYICAGMCYYFIKKLRVLAWVLVFRRSMFKIIA